MASKEIVPVIGLSTPAGVWSSAVIADARKLVFVSGLLGRDATGALVGPDDIGAQTRQVLENLKLCLAAAGTTLEHVVRVDVYVTRMDLFHEIHHVRRQYFPIDPPASTMVEVTRLAHPQAMIEITATAVLP